jgi:hypothetical protein
MLRTVLAVIGGYLVMAVVVFVTFTCLYLLLGADGAFQPGTFDPSAIWLLATFGVSLAAAMIGGFTALRIGGGGAVKGLLGLVIVLGLLSAIPAMTGTDDRPNVRTGDVANLDAMMQARQPAWVALSLPLIGAIGVMLGGRRSRA